MKEIEYLSPWEIERRSFEIIEEELKRMDICIPKEQESITKRVIHTTADFEYAGTMCYSENAVEIAKNLILNGADVVTDTNMALSGINRRNLNKFKGEVHCFMADKRVAELAEMRNTTRASVSMEFASQIEKPVIIAVGNAPTALLSILELMEKKDWKPAFVVGVPVGFVNVEAAKEMIMEAGIPYIVNRGRKGGSNVAAAIINALLYEVNPSRR